MTLPALDDERFAAQCDARIAVEARRQVADAMILLKNAAKTLQDARIMWIEMKALRGLCDCLGVIHRALSDAWLRYTKSASVGRGP